MPLLRRAGVFTAAVPEDWRLTASTSDDYHLAPPGGGRHGELRIAVFPRESAPFAEREGADRLIELLRELAVDPDDDQISFRARYRRDAHRAYAWFPVRDPAGHDRDCLVAVVVLPAAVIACTALASPRRPEIMATAELVVASITGDDRRSH
jgi:hypothetical protein